MSSSPTPPAEYVLHHDDERLNVTPWHREALRQHADAGGTLLWCYHGEWRTVPNAVLVNTLDTLEWWEKAPDRWQVRAPAGLGVIDISQTEQLEEVSLPHRQPPRHSRRRGQSGSRRGG